MKRLDALEDIMTFTLRIHRKMGSRPRFGQIGMDGGIDGYKIMRKPDGSRILFEHIIGFRIFKHQVMGDNSLLLTTMAGGIDFKGNKKIAIEARTYLTDLAVVNVYDHCTEFFSFSGIDFTYIEQDYGAHVQLLSDWLSEDPGIIRAQWSHKSSEVDRILDEIVVGRKIEQSVRDRRYIDMDL